MKSFFKKIALYATKALIPRIIRWLLSLVAVEVIAVQIKPFVQDIQRQLPPEYRPAFRLLLKKIAKVLERVD